MWCTSCRQDVPGIPEAAGDGAFGCARCGNALLNDSGIDLSGEIPAAPSKSAREPLDEYRDDLGDTIPFEPATEPRPELSRVSALRWDAANWELNEKLRHVERLTSAAAPRPSTFRSTRYDAPTSRFGGPHYLGAEAAPPAYEPSPFEPYAPQAPFEQVPFGAPYAPGYHPQPAGHPHAPVPPATDPSTYNETPGGLEAAASLTSWLFLGLAVGTFSCGGFLAAWGAVAERPHLQHMGMPIILGGMLALVVGLLPQIFLRRVQEDREAAQRSPARHATQRRAPHADYTGRPSHYDESAYAESAGRR